MHLKDMKSVAHKQRFYKMVLPMRNSRAKSSQSYLDGSVEKTFDYTEAIEKVLCSYDFHFSDNNYMSVSFYNGNDVEYCAYDVSFRVGVPNFFRAESVEESTYLDYEIVKVTDSTLHLKESASNATSHFECVKR